MKIKRFFAKDMRTALAHVKDTLGSDAVIMSNKKVAGGIEIVAAVDYDDPKPRTAGVMADVADDRVSLGRSNVVRARSQAPTAAPNVPPDSLQTLLERQQQLLSEQRQSRQPTAEPELPAWARGLEEASKADQTQLSPKAAPPQASSTGVEELREEMSALRALLTHQLSSLMSDQRQRQDPVGAMLEQHLLQADFS
ncbi:MAG: flagellar biosynthesis protein FlhF, partial [Shewanella sp.]|nr:flagellar biosynthesis protein FlhF [Shewanella sp.]